MELRCRPTFDHKASAGMRKARNRCVAPYWANRMITAPSLSRNWEDVFCTWGGAPSTTEREKCENAERAVRKAVGASMKLSGKTIEVFAQCKNHCN
jgi:hypothetical protein